MCRMILIGCIVIVMGNHDDGDWADGTSGE